MHDMIRALKAAKPDEWALLTRAFAAQNLVPYRPVFRAAIDLTAAESDNRTPFRLTRSVHTVAYAAVLQARKKLTAETAYVTFFEFLSQLDEAKTRAILKNGAGRWLANGGATTHALPGWLEDGWVDVIGVQEADYSTEQSGQVSLTIYEMVSAIGAPEGC